MYKKSAYKDKPKEKSFSEIKLSLDCKKEYKRENSQIINANKNLKKTSLGFNNRKDYSSAK
jgi:hypothetical protein